MNAIQVATSLAERDYDRNLSYFIGKMKLKAAFNFMIALLPKNPHDVNRLQSNDRGLSDDQSKLLEILESVKYHEIA